MTDRTDSDFHGIMKVISFFLWILVWSGSGILFYLVNLTIMQRHGVL